MQRNLKEKTFRLYVGVVQVLYRNIAGTGRTPSVQPKAMTGLAWCYGTRPNALLVLHSKSVRILVSCAVSRKESSALDRDQTLWEKGPPTPLRLLGGPKEPDSPATRQSAYITVLGAVTRCPDP